MHQESSQLTGGVTGRSIPASLSLESGGGAGFSSKLASGSLDPEGSEDWNMRKRFRCFETMRQLY